MPEAPEIKVIVDSIISLFKENSIKKLINVSIYDGQFENHGEILAPLFNQDVSDPVHHGKAIYLPVGIQFIKIHLMLAGHITFESGQNVIEFIFDNGIIGIKDRMHLAKVEVVSAVPVQPDCFTITEDEFVELFSSKPNRQIHLALVDQKLMAGIGSYLKSELLYKARQDPFTKIKDVDLINLYHCMQELLDEIVGAEGSAKYEGNYEFKVYKKRKDPDGNKILTKRKVYWVPQ